MKKQLSKIVLGLTLISFQAFSQERFQPCNTYAAMEEYFAQNPEARKNYEARQKAMQESFKEQQMTGAKSSAAFQYTIPVVFHILHTGGAENVSDAQVTYILQAINDDYAATTPDYTTIASPFKNSYINSDIKFILASKDPSGNGTTGINHVYDPKTEWQQGNQNYYLGYSNVWPTSKYLNIIVVKNIISSGPISGGVVGGYTYKPGTWGCNGAPDAIVVRSSAISQNQGRTISHEIGHWLNLAHTFGNTNNPGVNCGDDNIDNFGSPFDDTPPTKGHYSACPSSQSGNSCAPAATTYYGAGQANVENIMDYSTCPKNFTTGQTNVMRSTLASGQSCRPNLWSPSNLNGTGADGSGPAPNTFPPKAEFLSTNDSYTVCAGGSLTMKDFSYNGVIASYNWSADNGATAANATSSITAITFPNVGVSGVTLTVGNNGGTSVKVRNVTVIDGSANIAGDHMESFEQEGVPQNWNVINNNPNTSGWTQTWSAGLEGVGSFMIDGSLSGGGHQDILETPMFDLQSVPNSKFEFAVSYAQLTSSHNDVLKIQGTKDCGGTWQDITSLSGAQMQSSTGGITASSFTPTVPQEWKTYTVSNYTGYNQFTNSPNVRFRFTFIEGTAGAGNNIFIDAVKITSVPTSINELAKRFEFNVYPNPTNGEANIKFNAPSASSVKISVMNLLGQEVMTTSLNIAAGENNIVINKDHSLPEGAYLVNVKINNTMLSSKLMIN